MDRPASPAGDPVGVHDLRAAHLAFRSLLGSGGLETHAGLAHVEQTGDERVAAPGERDEPRTALDVPADAHEDVARTDLQQEGAPGSFVKMPEPVERRLVEKT